MGFEPARVYQKALYGAGIPATVFKVDDVQTEYERLLKLGVNFSISPRQAGPITMAVLDDTCGNHIQIARCDTSFIHTNTGPLYYSGPFIFSATYFYAILLYYYGS